MTQRFNNRLQAILLLGRQVGRPLSGSQAQRPAELQLEVADHQGPHFPPVNIGTAAPQEHPPCGYQIWNLLPGNL